MYNKLPGGIVLAAVAVGCALSAGNPAPSKDVFVKNNLVAWCIVPFDSVQRGPIERAQMLKRLGITMLAYDWRDKDIPTFDQEVDALKEQGIKLQSFWLTSGPDPKSEKSVGVILDFLKRRKVKTELWYMFRPPTGFDALPQEQKVAQAAGAVRYIAGEARKIGCSVGIYNHGGWYGEPENELAILRSVNLPNVGIVYNFHHGHEQIDRFPGFFPKILPHLMAVNLNGMKKEGPMIIPIGEGDRELEMLKVIRASGYQGPIGILNHSTERDAEVGLKLNMTGLQKLLRAMGDEAALKTY
jgi:sugar phosphate isomerase/epimerase